MFINLFIIIILYLTQYYNCLYIQAGAHIENIKAVTEATKKYSRGIKIGESIDFK
ncbi:hypothetical protein GCM10008904_21010 [Paraclostridium ghonii]